MSNPKSILNIPPPKFKPGPVDGTELSSTIAQQYRDVYSKFDLRYSNNDFGGLGTTGQVLTSNGASAVPTWQNAAGGSLPVIANNTVLGNTSGGSATATAIVSSSVTALIASSSGGGTTNFLRADGTWAAPPGASVALPGTIADLALWWESDDILGTNGNPIARLRDRTPWAGGAFCGNTSTTSPTNNPTIDSSQLNGLNVVNWSSTGRYFLLNNFITVMGGITVFVVAKGNTTPGNQAIIGSGSSGFALYLSAGSQAIAIAKSGVSVFATCSTTWTAATWFQANVTYLPSSGAYAFRQGQANANSGTGTTGAGGSAPNGGIQYFAADSNTNSLNNSSLAAVIVYARVLGGSEITSVEGYLHSKWNV